MQHLKCIGGGAGFHVVLPGYNIIRHVCKSGLLGLRHCRTVHRLSTVPSPILCQLSPWPHPQSHPYLHTGYSRREHLHTTASLNADEKKKIWAKFASTIRMFTAGVKSLYRDVKLMNEYKAKHGKLVIQKTAPIMDSDGKTDFLYSREELQHVYRTRRDVKKMFPTVILFFIPFLGYIAPILAFAYPEKLLSQHFWPPSLRTDLEASVCETQKATFSALLHKLKEGSGLEKGLSFIPKMIEEFAGKENILTNAELVSFETAELPANHWEHLLKGWGINPFIPFQRQQLQSYLEYVFVSDWLMALEGGVQKFTHSELVTACMERGLHFDLEVEESSKEMRKMLNLWICISTQHKECPTLLLAYLPVAQYSL